MMQNKISRHVYFAGMVVSAAPSCGGATTSANEHMAREVNNFDAAKTYRKFINLVSAKCDDSTVAFSIARIRPGTAR